MPIPGNPVIGGPAGPAGSTILNGAGAPAAGVGANGDFYIDTTADAIYGPKTAGAWGAATALVGPAGPTGAQGPAGATGAQGPAGTNGTNGKTVLNGTGAPASGTGVDGDFYIDTNEKKIFGPKTAGSWGLSTNLIGPQGPQGPQGVTGPQGAQGPAGPQGPAGTNGTNGTNGVDGKTVRSGAGAPAAGTGVDGDFYIDTTAWQIYGPKAAGAWGAGVNIVGPQGPAGPAGADGSNTFKVVNRWFDLTLDQTTTTERDIINYTIPAQTFDASSAMVLEFMIQRRPDSAQGCTLRIRIGGETILFRATNFSSEALIRGRFIMHNANNISNQIWNTVGLITSGFYWGGTFNEMSGVTDPVLKTMINFGTNQAFRLTGSWDGTGSGNIVVPYFVMYRHRMV